MSKKAIRAIFAFLRRHKKKSAFVALILVIYQLGKRGYLTKPLYAIINLVQKVLIWRMHSAAEKAQREIVLVTKADELAESLKTKSIPKSTSLFNTLLREEYSTSEIYDVLKKQAANGNAKTVHWQSLGLKIYQRLVTTLVLKGTFDFSNYLTFIAKAMLEAENNRRTNRNKKSLFLDLKQNMESKPDVRPEQESKEITQAVELIKEFVKAFNEIIFKRFANFIEEEIDWENEMPLDERNLKERTGIQDFSSRLIGTCNRISRPYIIERAGRLPNYRKSSIVLDMLKFKLQLSARPRFGFKQLMNMILKPIGSQQTSLFEDFMAQFKGLRVEPCQESDLQKAYDVSLPVVGLLNMTLDMITSNYFFAFNSIYSDYLSAKLYNRLLLLFKKEKGEDALWEESSKMVLAKLLTHSDKILDEEFLAFDYLKIDQEMLLKKIKLAMYFLRLYKKQKSKENADQPSHAHAEVAAPIEEDPEESPLNITMIGSMNLESPKLIESTNLFLQELLGFEMSVSSLKELTRQLLIE
jgi:hypothetical protein